MIISAHNAKIKWVRALQSSSRERQEAGVFVVEGVRLAEEALASGWPAQLALYTEDLGPRGMEVLERLSAAGAVLEPVSEAVMRAASDTQTPQGILAVLAFRQLALPDHADFSFIPDEVRDPGNLGSMLRTAAAAGVQAVFLPPGTADPFSPKVLRAGIGAQFRLPALALTWEELAARLKDWPIYLAAAGAGAPYFEVGFHSPMALIVGGEAEGAGAEARRLATHCVHIPMPGGGESLNAAAAAAILLFEVARQRASPR
jgi:RNA methyltransferase, TrmH family